MNLTDATLIVPCEAEAHPELAALTRSEYDELAAGNEVPRTIDPLTAPLGHLRQHERRDYHR